jgi:hypothetical protein
MNTEDALETLKRLRTQIDIGIQCVELGHLVYDPQRCRHDLFLPCDKGRQIAVLADMRIGDFLIYDTKKHDNLTAD